MRMSPRNKSTTLLNAAAIATLSLLSVTAAWAAVPSSSLALEGSRPRMLTNAIHVGSVDESKRITISVYLKFRNAKELDQLVEDQQTPGSGHYQEFLTPEEFHQRFSPLPEDVAKVKQELAKMGFEVVYAPTGGLFVTATGTVGQAKRAFQVSQELYSIGGKTVRSHAEAPVVPASIAPLVLHIAGLDDTKKFVKSFSGLRSGKAANKHSVVPYADPPEAAGVTRSPCNVNYASPLVATLTPAVPGYSPQMEFTNCGYNPTQIRSAYGADKVTSTGKGVRVGLVDFYLSTTLEQDLNQYSKDNGLPQVNYASFQVVAPPGLANAPDRDACDPDDWSVESTLDVESVHSIAPGADIVYFGEACDAVYPIPMQAMYQAIDNRLADVLSGSFGGPELVFATAQEEADNAELKQAASLGITVMFSSGDSGDYLQEDQYGDPGAPIAEVSWPASSPWVTAVGGTSMLLDSKSVGGKTEYGWGTFQNYANIDTWTGPFQIFAGSWSDWGFAGGGGGGTSLFMTQPSYQNGIVPKSLSEVVNTQNTGSINLGAAHRVVPYLAMLADPSTGIIVGQTMLEQSPGTVDVGCRAIKSPKGAEYCTFQVGGTSVASPLFAGVVAIVDSARLSSGKGVLSFANPTLYKLHVGVNGSTAPIWDVRPPTRELELADNEGDDPGFTEISAVAINMTPVNPDDANTAWILGGDSKLKTTEGFDNVTGLGAPWVPGMIEVLAPDAH